VCFEGGDSVVRTMGGLVVEISLAMVLEELQSAFSRYKMVWWSVHVFHMALEFFTVPRSEPDPVSVSG